MQNDRDPLDQASQSWGGIYSHSRGDSGFLGPCFVAVFFFFWRWAEPTISKVPSSIKNKPVSRRRAKFANTEVTLVQPQAEAYHQEGGDSNRTRDTRN